MWHQMFAELACQGQQCLELIKKDDMIGKVSGTHAVPVAALESGSFRKSGIGLPLLFPPHLSLCIFRA